MLKYMRTIKIDILNEKAVNILRELELLDLIRLRRENLEEFSDDKERHKFKGAMTKQPLEEINQQLNKLRNEWE